MPHLIDKIRDVGLHVVRQSLGQLTRHAVVCHHHLDAVLCSIHLHKKGKTAVDKTNQWLKSILTVFARRKKLD